MSRIGKAGAAEKLSNQAAGLTKVIGGTLGIRQSNIALQLTGSSAAAWTADNKAAGERGTAFLVRQAGQIAGGTLEMSRNVVSEWLLGMPRELTVDRDVPFRDVPRGPSPTESSCFDLSVGLSSRLTSGTSQVASRSPIAGHKAGLSVLGTHCWTTTFSVQ
jgi:hypothetical protein